MDEKALGFVGRGMERKMEMPFEARPKTRRLCRGCDDVCPRDYPLPGHHRNRRPVWQMRPDRGDAELLFNRNLRLLLRTEPALKIGLSYSFGNRIEKISPLFFRSN